LRVAAEVLHMPRPIPGRRRGAARRSSRVRRWAGGVSPVEVGSYEWAGRSSERHRAQIREHLGFRECSVADAERLAAWLVEHVVERERRPERVREELLARCLSERIEPPAAGRIDRVVRSALRTGEVTLSARVASRLNDE